MAGADPPFKMRRAFQSVISVDPEGGSVLSGRGGSHQDRTQGSIPRGPGQRALRGSRAGIVVLFGTLWCFWCAHHVIGVKPLSTPSMSAEVPMYTTNNVPRFAY